MGKFTKPIGYIEQKGGCIIKKVSSYGYKYVVYKGLCFWRFADLHKARSFAMKQ